MQLRCRKCRRVISPVDPMTVVEVGTPETWQGPRYVHERLEVAIGRWHYSCTPQPVRAYAPPIVSLPPSRHEENDRIQGQLAKIAQHFHADRVTMWQPSPDGMMLASSHSWFTPEVGPAEAVLDLRTQSNLRAWLDTRHESFAASRSELTREQAEELAALDSMARINSAAFVPVRVNGFLLGLVTVATRLEQHWPIAALEHLQQAVLQLFM